MSWPPARRIARLAWPGRYRLRTALWGAMLAATIITLLTSLPAHAAPTPTPSPSSPVPTAGSGGGEAPSQEDLAQIEDWLAHQNESLSKSAQAAMLKAQADQLREQLPDEGGILGVFNVTDANNLPISVYSVQSDTGGPLRWDLGLLNLLTELCYMVTKWLIAFCCWLIGWALSFGLAKLLLAPALAISTSLHTRVTMEMGLPALFLAVCALICTCRIFFGDRARGWGDAALSILLAALTTTLLSSTPQTLLGQDTGALAITRTFSLQVADVILDADPTTPTPDITTPTPATSFTLSRPLTDALTDAFIVRPAMLLQYGRIFEGECASDYTQTRLAQLAYDRQVDAIAARASKINHLADYIAPSGLSSTLDWQSQAGLTWAKNHFGNAPMDAFEEHCVKGDASAAKQASLDKLGGSLFLLIAAFIVSTVVAGLTLSFLTAQCRIAWDAIRGEPALIAGTIPGAGRAFLWDWGASVLRSLAQLLASVTSLAIFILIVQAVLDPVQTDWGRELTLRFLAVDVVCLAALHKRRHLATRTHQIANNFKAKMAGLRIGGTHGSILTPTATPITPNPHLGRKTARGLTRGALAATALARGNPLAALGYAMPQTVGSAALISRLTSHRRGHGHGPRRRTARPAGRPAPARAAQPGPTTPPGPPRPPGRTPQPHPTRPQGPPPRPLHRPGAQPARAAGPRHGAEASPRRSPAPRAAASQQQQMLRRRLERGHRRATQQATTTPRRSSPNRTARGEDAEPRHRRDQQGEGT